MLCERYEKPALARKFDHVIFAISAVVFTSISVKMIVDAIGS
jgi:hypothetical protein